MIGSLLLFQNLSRVLFFREIAARPNSLHLVSFSFHREESEGCWLREIGSFFTPGGVGLKFFLLNKCIEKKMAFETRTAPYQVQNTIFSDSKNARGKKTLEKFNKKWKSVLDVLFICGWV